MAQSYSSAEYKRKRGKAILDTGTNDPDKLGAALLALHGGLEDHLREMLVRQEPSLRGEVLNSSNVQWRGLLELAEKHLGTSSQASAFILQAGSHRNRFAHGSDLGWDRAGVCAYENLIGQLWGSGVGAEQPKTNTPRQTFKQPMREEAPYNPRPWYRSTGFYWFLFLFLLPVWFLMILSDRQQGGFTKGFAVLVMMFYMGAALTLWVTLPSLPAVLGGAIHRPTYVAAPTEAPLPLPGGAALPTLTPGAKAPVTGPIIGGQPTSTTAPNCQVEWVQYKDSDLANKNRSSVWNEIVSQQVRGAEMDAAQFYQQVVQRNPDLKTDGYVFLRGKTYLLPRCK